MFLLLIQWGNPQGTTNRIAKVQANMQVMHILVPKLESLGMMLGHAQEKPHLLICACMIGDFGLIKLSFLLKSDAAWPEKQ